MRKCHLNVIVDEGNCLSRRFEEKKTISSIRLDALEGNAKLLEGRTTSP
jgi:hypothetical protein